MIKIAMLSKWHVHAGDYAAQIIRNKNAEVAAVWDDDAERGSEWAASLGVEFVPDLDALLARSDIDAVVCDSPTTAHGDLLMRSAKAKKHIFTEKVLAVTSKEADALTAAIKEAGIIFAISYPVTRYPSMLLAKKLIDEGVFGTVAMIRFRRAHTGVSDGWLPEYWYDTEKSGGGSLMDLGAHPLYMLDWLASSPVKTVKSVRTKPLGRLQGDRNDENATVLFEFENGITGVGETSFVAYGSPDILEIHGTDAALYINGDDVRLVTKDSQNAPYTLPEKPANPLEAFIEACNGGAPVPASLNIDAARRLSHLMELSYL